MNGNALAPLVRAFHQTQDALAGRVVGSLHTLFGYQFSKNQEYFVYLPEDRPIALAAASGSTATSVVEITQEADFVCTAITGFVRLNSDADQKPENGVGNGEPIEIKLTDGSTDRQLMTNFVHSTLFFAPILLPNIWPKARLFTRNSTIRIDLRSLGNSGATDCFLAFHGWKIFDTESLDLTRRR